VMRFMWSAEHF